MRAISWPPASGLALPRLRARRGPAGPRPLPGRPAPPAASSLGLRPSDRWPFWPGWLDIAWAAFSALNLAAIVVFERWETIPFHFIWISVTLLYGFRIWPAKPTLWVLPEQLTTEEYGIAVRKDTPELRDAVNAGLKKIKADGTYDKLVQKWFEAGK